ncbi:MAG: winged helix-turn-helix transcriptional regulator [Chloroflexi bacterium]|nr:winged helix-turn-helix transcriptional regulator [Chloroflexota bacterium]
MDPSVADRRKLAGLFRVLSEPNRLAIFDLLMQGVQCNCEIGKRLGLPMNLVSHHLRVLRDAGLVEAQREPTDARWVYYSVKKAALTECCARITEFLAPSRIQPRLPSCGPASAQPITERLVPSAIHLERD